MQDAFVLLTMITRKVTKGPAEDTFLYLGRA